MWSVRTSGHKGSKLLQDGQEQNRTAAAMGKRAPLGAVRRAYFDARTARSPPFGQLACYQGTVRAEKPFQVTIWSNSLLACSCCRCALASGQERNRPAGSPASQLAPTMQKFVLLALHRPLHCTMLR